MFRDLDINSLSFVQQLGFCRYLYRYTILYYGDAALHDFNRYKNYV